MNKRFIIILTVFIDVLGIGIIIPVLPFYVQSFETSALTVTLLFAIFSFFSLFSAPLLGAWSDRVGRRPVLIISLMSTALGWLIFAAAPSVLWLFIGRIIDGVAAGNFPIAQSYLLDIAKTEKERTVNLGVIGATFGFGLIIGPLLGGFMSHYYLSLPFFFVGFLALANGILAFFILPESNLSKQAQKKIDLNPLRPIFNSFKNKKLRLGLTVWFLFGLAMAADHSIFSLFIEDRFGFGSLAASLFLAGIGIILIFNQTFALKKIWLKYFDEEKLSLVFFILVTIGFLAMSLGYLTIFIVGLAIMSLTQSIIRITVTSQITKRASRDNQGEVLGLMSSVMSLSMIIGPISAGALFLLDSRWPYLSAALFSLVAFIILLIDYKINRNAIADSKITEEDMLIEQQQIELAG